MFMEIDDPITNDELEVVDEAIQLIKAKTLIRKMRSACEKALSLPRLTISANDALCSTNEIRQRKSAIESELNKVIAEAAEFSK